jgi:soluble cytochrome b562
MSAPAAVRMRSSAACLAAAAALGLGACGASDGGGGNTSDYKASLNTFCGSVDQAQKSVQSSIQKIQSDPKSARDPQSAIRGFGTALGGFGTDLHAALDKLKGAKPPEKYAKFHDGAVTAIGQLAGKVDEAAKATKSGNVQALSSFGSDVNKIKVPDVPKDLKQGVPKCDSLSTSA